MHLKNTHYSALCSAGNTVHLGNLLENDNRFSRFHTFFADEEDYWLVFKDEGISLNNLLYQSSLTAFFVLEKASNYDDWEGDHDKRSPTVDPRSCCAPS